MDKRLTAKAPVRLDFAGGWTDVEEFAHDKFHRALGLPEIEE